MGETTIRQRVVVHGRVQGVSYRASCADAAHAEGLAGWVANEPDGTVVAELEGTAEAVGRVVRWCHVGPAHALVDRVDVADVPVVGDEGFEVR